MVNFPLNSNGRYEVESGLFLNSISAIPDSVVTRPNDDISFSDSEGYGMVVEPSQDWPDIGAELSNNLSGATRAYIYDFSDGTLLGDTDISGLSAGDTFTFGVSISAGGQYSFVVDAEGSSFTVGRLDGSSDLYPYTSSDGNLELTGSIEGANGLTSFGNNEHAYSFTRIGDVGF